MAKSVSRAVPRKPAPKRAEPPGKMRTAEEAISGFIRTLERLDSVSTQATPISTQNKAQPHLSEGQ